MTRGCVAMPNRTHWIEPSERARQARRILDLGHKSGGDVR